MEVDLHVGIDLLDGVPGTVDFFPTDITRAVEDLSLEVGKINGIKIDKADSPDPGGCKIEGDRGTETPGADTEYAGRLDALLPLQGHFGHDKMARVTCDLIIAQFDGCGTRRINDAFVHKRV